MKSPDAGRLQLAIRMPSQWVLFFCLFFLNMYSAESLPERVTVKLFQTRQPVKSISFDGPVKLEGRDAGMLPFGRFQIRRTESLLDLLSVDIRKGNVSFARGHRFIFSSNDNRGIKLRVNGKPAYRYPGRIIFQVSKSKGAIDVINQVHPRQYAISVVANELPPGFHQEAKKALAVLTLTRLEFVSKALDDSTRREIYRGLTGVGPDSVQAVEECWRKRVRFEGSLIEPFYHSTCAGSTSSVTDIFGGNPADFTYSKPVTCGFCKESPFWKSKFSSFSEERILACFTDLRPSVEDRDKSGRPTLVHLTDKSGNVKEAISGYKAWLQLGRGLGWGAAPGTRFNIKRDAGTGRVEIESRGAGHGVGLCQWGADGMARQGKSYKEIVEYYFPKAVVE